MRNIRKVQKGKAPTLLDTDKANEIITAVNALMNMQIERGGDTDYFEISHNNSLLSISDHSEQSGGSLDATTLTAYVCVNGNAVLKNFYIEE